MKTSALALAVLAFVAAPAAPPLAAQVPEHAAGWNSARVRALVERGRTHRVAPLVDPAFRSYRARAEGSIYFYIDPDAGDPVLMRADQVAVDLYWAFPDHTQQVLIGQHIERRLPIRDFRYYIDRLTLVQEGFGDEIQVGEGMDVRNVAHPLAPDAEAVYDYRLADSLVLRLPGSPPIRAYEIVVRPRFPERPGFVGSLFVDEATGALVRMAFSFTRASYVDRRNDYVRITLDHGLWHGRHWLPHEQQVIVRRELPELDLGAGTVIRATLRVTDYEFDIELPASVRRGPPITAAPLAEREAYVFEQGVYDDLVRAGISPAGDLAALQAEARRILRDRAASGLPRTRPAVPTVSSLVRYNRAEGLYLGGGVRTASPLGETTVLAGHAFGAETPRVTVQGRIRARPRTRVEWTGYYRELRDHGPRSGAPGALNTLAVIFTGDDYLDPYNAHGARLAVEHVPRDGIGLGLLLRAERHRSASRAAASAPFEDEPFRAVVPVEHGDLAAGTATLRARAPAYRTLRPVAELALHARRWAGRMHAAADVNAALGWTSPRLGASAEARVSGGVTGAAAPPQLLHYIGGPGSLPGWPYRAFGGTRYVLAELEAAADIAAPWLSARVFAAAGAAGGPLDEARGGMPAAASGGLRYSAGAGVALLHRIVRIDYAHGLDGGRSVLLFSIDPRFRPWL